MNMKLSRETLLPPPLPKAFVKALKKIVGKGRVFTSGPEMVAYSFDATKLASWPQAVVIPTELSQVAPVVRLCNQHRVHFIPRGEGTGFTGGTVPVTGGVVLVLNELNAISFKIGPPPYIEAEVGAVTNTIQDLANENAYFYPPDPASQKYSTIGGNVAVGAGGPHCLKYGTTRDYVLGLDLVLPDGEEVSVNRNDDRRDLLELLIGSEGTLGVIVRVRLRLVPEPPHTASMMVAFKDNISAIRGVSRVVADGLIPSKLEFIDNQCLKAIGGYMESPLPTEGAVILMEEDGSPEDVEFTLKRAAELARKEGAVHILIAKDEETKDLLWEARNAISPSLSRYGPTKINEDVCVPIDHMAEVMDKIEGIAHKRGVFVANFGHAGDGNIHVNFIGDARRPKEIAEIEKAVEEVFALVLSVNGTITGEHGEAITKQSFLPDEVSPLAYSLFKRIKNSLDGEGIFNPGKIFPLENPPA